MSLNQPKALHQGDLIGIVAPGEYSPRNSDLLVGRERLEAAGFRVAFGTHIKDQYGYLAGTDEQRADDFNAMLSDPDVRAILTWGSIWGAARLLALIDYDAARHDPKLVIGCGNTTALLNALLQRAGLITLHGATLGTFFRSAYTNNAFLRAITSTEALGSVGQPADGDYPPLVPYVSGRASGMLVGGNVAAVASSLGTPAEIDTAGKILLLEARDLRPEMLSRYLTVLTNSGKLTAAAGIVVTELVDCASHDTYNTFSLEGVLEDRLLPLSVPSLYGLRLGQGRDSATVPLGAQATLDTATRTLTIDTPALSEN